MISPTAIIEDSADVAEGVVVSHWAYVGHGVSLAESVTVGHHSVVESGVVVGVGSRIWCFSRVRDGAVIGVRTNVGDHVYIGPGVTIGDDTRVGNGVQIHSPARVGDRVFLGPNSFLGNDRYPQIGPQSHFQPQPVTIDDDVIISASADICGGVTIGRGAFVGMDANVLHDVPSGAIVFGNPAKVRGWRTVHEDADGVHFGPLCPSHRCAICGRVDEEVPPSV